MRIILSWHIYCFKKLFRSLQRAFVFTTRKTEILSVNFPKIMFKLQNHFGYEAVKKEKTIYKFEINFAVPFYIFLFRIITSCNGHFPAMDA